MTPKTKAKQLVDKFRNVEWIEEDKEIIRFNWIQCIEAKQCALIAVDEIMSALDKNLDASQFHVMNYWQEVIEKIEAL